MDRLGQGGWVSGSPPKGDGSPVLSELYVCSESIRSRTHGKGGVWYVWSLYFNTQGFTRGELNI